MSKKNPYSNVSIGQDAARALLSAETATRLPLKQYITPSMHCSYPKEDLDATCLAIPSDDVANILKISPPDGNAKLFALGEALEKSGAWVGTSTDGINGKYLSSATPRSGSGNKIFVFSEQALQSLVQGKTPTRQKM